MPAETAAGDELPPPENAYTPSDDELDELVGNATDDIATEATDEEPEPTVAASEPESTKGTETEEAAAGQEAEERVEEEGAEPPTEPEPAAPAAQAPKGKPFKFKASGAEHTFQGVDELPDGTLRVSKDATPQFRGVLASYVELQRTSKEQRRNDQREIIRLRRERSDKDLEADAITKLFKDLETMSHEDRWVWAENYVENKKALELDIKQQQLDRKEKALAERDKGPELLPEEEQEILTQSAQREVHATFQRLLALPEAKHLPAEDRKALYEKWSKRAAKLATRATEDMPEIGVKKGQMYFDDSDIVDDFNERVALLKRATGTVTAAQRNAQRNADQQGQRRTPPPTIRGGKVPTGPAGKPGKDLRGDKKGFKKKFLAGELDAKE
jgi:hypothetical protein